jgi:hypothetical protein
MSWMSGPMLDPIESSTSVPLGSDDIAGAEPEEADAEE